jgi:hypothetical protein
MPKETAKSRLMLWCAKKQIYSKAELMRYGCDNYYLRAWREACIFVNDGLARKLTRQECIDRNLTTSMGWYAWLGEPEPADLPQEYEIKQHNLSVETNLNKKAVQMEFV